MSDSVFRRMSICCQALCCLLVVCGLAESRAWGEPLMLTLDWNEVQLDAPFPVTGGVPLARGALKDDKQVALEIDGQFVPVQTQVLARWPDRSVKWLLLDFQAKTSQKQVVLHYGQDIKPSQIQQILSESAIKVVSSPSQASIDTGIIRFSVRKNGNGFIDDLSYQNESVFEHKPGKRFNVMDALHLASPADYHPYNRFLNNPQADPSKVKITGLAVENKGPLHAIVRLDGVYSYQYMGSTIEGTDIKGDCPFRIRIHAYAGQSLLKIEHFFYYEGDGDHDYVESISLRLPTPADASGIRYLDGQSSQVVAGPQAGLYQKDADHFQIWTSQGSHATVQQTGHRFQGVMDVRGEKASITVGVKDFWKHGAKSLHADLQGQEIRINLWAPEAPPLDFRRHAREWSVGETGTPDRPTGVNPEPFTPKHNPNYRLASKGVGKTHFSFIYLHDGQQADDQLLGRYRLFNQRPLVWAPTSHYANTLALGRYREYVPGEYEELEQAISDPVNFWKFSQEHFRWYGFWLYGNVLQSINLYEINGRWTRDFGRWGWANGDSVGRLAYALMLQSVRKAQRSDFEFAEAYLYAVHDTCSIHTPAFPRRYGNAFTYVKGAAHRHDAWPWADLYTGARGAHPVGVKIYYYLTGEGHAKDILEELVALTENNPGGGEGDATVGHNAQIYIYLWETTGQGQWRAKLKEELDKSELLHKGQGGWNVMMASAFGIHNAMEEYGDLTGDQSYTALATSFADRAASTQMAKHWTWGGYYRVYSHALNMSANPHYLDELNVMLKVFLDKNNGSLARRYPASQWPGPAGGPKVLIDANIIRDIPFTLYAMEHFKKYRKPVLE